MTFRRATTRAFGPERIYLLLRTLSLLRTLCTYALAGICASVRLYVLQWQADLERHAGLISSPLLQRKKHDPNVSINWHTRSNFTL